jgi:hypothetical protein
MSHIFPKTVPLVRAVSGRVILLPSLLYSFALSTIEPPAYCRFAGAMTFRYGTIYNIRKNPYKSKSGVALFPLERGADSATDCLKALNGNGNHRFEKYFE